MKSSTVPIHANIWKNIKSQVLWRTTCYCLVKENLNIIDRNACYHWSQYLLSPHFLSRNIKLIHQTIISPIFKVSHSQRRTQTKRIVRKVCECKIDEEPPELTWQCILTQGLKFVGSTAAGNGATIYLVIGLLLVPEWSLCCIILWLRRKPAPRGCGCWGSSTGNATQTWCWAAATARAW